MNDNTGETLLDLDDVLNKSMDEVEEAAGFITPSAGTYHLAVPFCKSQRYKKKAAKDAADQSPVQSARIQLGWQVIALLEKSNPEDEDTPVNGLFTEVFQFNEQGLSYFKARANDILETTEGLTVGETIKAINDAAAVVKAKVTIRETPKTDNATGQAAGKYINVQVKILNKVDDIPFPELPGAKKDAPAAA